MVSEFNAKASRAKRPCPMWVDAFQRDTQHLEADEIGAYFLIIMAMWTRESCDLPDDDIRLSRIARVSLRLWKSRIGPAIRAFLLSEPGTVISKRLREEAAYVESEVQKQSDRKRGTYAKPQGMSDASGENGKNTGNLLNNNDTGSTTDTTTDQPRHHPSQQPNNLHKNVVQCSADAREDSENPAFGLGEDQPQPTHFPADPAMDQLYDDVLKAAGLARGRMIPSGWLPPASTLHIARWRTLGITEAEIIAGVRNSQARYSDPPTSPKAYDHIMRQIAAAKQQPALTIPQGGNHVIRSEQSKSAAEREDRIRLAAIRGST